MKFLIINFILTAFSGENSLWGLNAGPCTPAGVFGIRGLKVIKGVLEKPKKQFLKVP